MTRSMALVALLATLISLPALAAETRHTVILGGNKAGIQITNVAADGTREVSYEFTDRGRGPKIVSRIKVNEAGLPVSVQASGNDYLKVPVKETFTLEQGVARWKNDAESGEKKLTAPAFYVSLQSVPEEGALLANALLKAEGQKLALLPEGQATAQRGDEVTLKSASGTRRVMSYEISGLGFAPETIWLDENGAFFAAVSSWSSFILEGWESSVSELMELQDKRANVRMQESARALTRMPKGPLAIVNANLFDSQTGKSIPGSTVLVEGNRIKAVGADGKVAIPAGAERIDARGRALLPGLADMHVHLGEHEGVQHLAAGVTMVRDMANDPDALLGFKRRFDAGEELGPRIFMSGIIEGPGPFAGPTKVLVDNEAKAREAVDNYAKLGYQGVKIYSSVKPELVPVIAKLAHDKGLRVGGHVPAYMTARQFIEAGADEMQHINFVFLNFFFDEVQDTRTPARFTSVAQRGSKLDLNSSEVRSFVQLMKDKHVVLDPTVTVFNTMMTRQPGTVGPGYAPIAGRLPPQIRRSLLTGGLPIPKGSEQQYRDSADALLRMIKLLYDSGITLVAGTDDLPGFTLHRELELYVQAGISAPETLRIATLNAAKVLEREADLGAIAPGKIADMILVDGDPARRISDIRNTDLVVKDGKVYEVDALYRSIGVLPR
ncbi:amidohydrolase family protein [Peristeroidobacter agariperforans]|uniref:amidohydrolase family protein n=1 Tax=Peristeroidobacter agariperforans TaxID=268404 RepID=UPI00101C5F61|nr:amidohydrolase family protein [Peristeroidobacter agariperforans]